MSKVVAKKQPQKLSVEQVAAIIRRMSDKQRRRLFQLVSDIKRTLPSRRNPFGISDAEAEGVIEQARREMLELSGGAFPSDDDPYFGGLTRREYFNLSEEEREALWDKLYAEFERDIDDIEEHHVKPHAVVAGQKRHP